MGKVTLQTIADRVGVSRMTVSNAFSRPDQLSAELRDRILSTARELGYAGPDPTARALARGTTGAVGVLLTDSLRVAFTDEIAMAFLSAVVDGLAPTGLALTLLTVDERDDVVPARDVAIDGAVVYSCHYDRSTARDWLLRRRLPLVFVDQDPQPGIPGVNVDDRGGARAAAQHVVDLGHRRIGILNAVDRGSRGLVEDPSRRSRATRAAADARLARRPRRGRHRARPSCTRARTGSTMPPPRPRVAVAVDRPADGGPVLLRRGRPHVIRAAERARAARPRATCRWSASTTAQPPR